MKKQGYNARLNESLGERHRGPKMQDMKSRRDESEAREKMVKCRKFGAVRTMKGKK